MTAIAQKNLSLQNPVFLCLRYRLWELKKLRIKKWSCLANKEKDLMHWWSFIVWPRRSYIWNQSSKQDRDRSTSEDFDLEKLGRCAKASHPLCDASKKRAAGDGCWRNGSSLTDARATVWVKGEKPLLSSLWRHNELFFREILLK